MTPAPSPSATPAPAGDRVKLQATSTKDYYDVYGDTSQEIVSYMANYGPTTSDGLRGLGIARPTIDLDWQPDSNAGACRIGSMQLTISVAVTLPRHAQLSNLSQTLRALWLEFADSVAAHEQHHVDIYMAGMEELREEFAALPPSREGCQALTNSVQSLWNTGIDSIKAQQDAFHAREDARLNTTRAALKSQYEATDVQLAALRGQITSLETKLADHEAQLKTLNEQASSLEKQLNAIKAQYPNLILPPEVFAQFENLRVPYNVLVQRYEELFDEYEGLIKQRNDMAAQHDSLVDERNRLVDRYNLTP